MDGSVGLRDAWELRNAATATLTKAERQMQRLAVAATPEQIVGLLEGFSPARSPGPDWTRTFEPLIERLWMWCDPKTLAAVEAEFRGRGPAWLAIANSLTPERGETIRGRLERHSAQSRLPAFTIE
jgi:hypothetical protein